MHDLDTISTRTLLRELLSRFDVAVFFCRSNKTGDPAIYFDPKRFGREQFDELVEGFTSMDFDTAPSHTPEF